VDPTARHSHIAIARIVRTRGIRGEVLAELHTDFPSRFSLLNRVWLEFPDGNLRCFDVEHCWAHKGRQVLKFARIDSIAEAEILVGTWVVIEADQTVPIPHGTYWDYDLVGCTVRDKEGRSLGLVREVMHIVGNAQLVVQGQRGEFFVPVVAAICTEVSIPRKEIVVDLPEGLLDLNE
jgi:16S rRNA processing protein RimM